MAAAAIKRWRGPAVIFCGTLLVLLFVESLSAWPDYIPFFNVVFGGKRGGFALLGDSNLDWGQDIKALADWQKLNPDIPLYLHCFASVDPAGFGLKYHRFDLSADGSQLICDVPLKAGVIAVSTNYLQGLYCGPNDREFFRQLGQTPPATIIGGSIYLYRYPLR
jgi:hypothetical protein